MESPTPFDLDKAVQAWCLELGLKHRVEPTNVLELRAHLREAIADLQRKGLTDEDAFRAAYERLGSPAVLAAEYAKTASAKTWAPRVFWMAGGALVTYLWIVIYAIILVEFSNTDKESMDVTVATIVWGVPLALIGGWGVWGRTNFLSSFLTTRLRVASVGTGLLAAVWGLMVAADYFNRLAANDHYALFANGVHEVFRVLLGTDIMLISLMVWLVPQRQFHGLQMLQRLLPKLGPDAAKQQWRLNSWKRMNFTWMAIGALYAYFWFVGMTPIVLGVSEKLWVPLGFDPADRHQVSIIITQMLLCLAIWLIGSGLVRGYFDKILPRLRFPRLTGLVRGIVLVGLVWGIMAADFSLNPFQLNLPIQEVAAPGIGLVLLMSWLVMWPNERSGSPREA